MWGGGVAALNTDGGGGEATSKFWVSVLSYFILFTFMLESRSLLLLSFFSLILLPFFVILIL